MVVAVEGQIPFLPMVMASAQVWKASYLFYLSYHAPFTLNKFNIANVIRKATPIKNVIIEQ